MVAEGGGQDARPFLERAGSGFARRLRAQVERRGERRTSAVKSLELSTSFQPSENCLSPATGSSASMAFTIPAAIASPAYSVASAMSSALPPGKWW